MIVGHWMKILPLFVWLFIKSWELGQTSGLEQSPWRQRGQQSGHFRFGKIDEAISGHISGSMQAPWWQNGQHSGHFAFGKDETGSNIKRNQ